MDDEPAPSNLQNSQRSEIPNSQLGYASGEDEVADSQPNFLQDTRSQDDPLSEFDTYSMRGDDTQATPATPMQRGLMTSIDGAQTPLTPRASTALPRGDLGRLRQQSFNIRPGIPFGSPPSNTPTEAGAGGTPTTPNRYSRAPQTPGSEYGSPHGLLSPSQDPNTPAPFSPLVPPPSQAGLPTIGAVGGISEAVIWGTNVNVDVVAERFRQFLITFLPEGDHNDEPLYLRKLAEIRRTQVFSLSIDCRHIYAFPPTRKLYNQLIAYPQEIVPVMDLVVNEVFASEIGGQDLGSVRIQVRTCSIRTLHQLRRLDPINIDQMVAIRGMITRVSPVVPDLKQAFFRCMICGHCEEVMIDRGRIEEPKQCGSCQSKFSYEIVHNRCAFTDKQLVRLQETPDEIPEGETPHSVTLFTFDDLVDSVRPGDRVEVTGIFRAVGKRPSPKFRTLNSLYKTYIDVIHFKLINRSSEGDLDDDDDQQENSALATFSQERINEIQALSRQPDIYEILKNAIAPSIWELDDIKKGVLCQLFGGNAFKIEEQKAERHGGGGKKGQGKRGEINVLLCGDPGTSKSQLLSYVHKISPRGVYTSGKGSSAVGLTASVVQDPETRQPVLESGALVLSDNGICCIDEFDKMSDSTRAILHEVMEQQTISVARAGIICTLNARTAILASANPVESRYNPNRSVVDNIRLPPTLLSRFDLIYLILDKPIRESDRRLARHLVGLYDKDPPPPRTDVNQGLLRDYISYARRFCQPEIVDEAVAELRKGYLDMRRAGGQGTKVIAATPRQLESLIRISEALARMRLSNWVTAADVQEAIRLMRVATQAAATDPRTGTIDMDMITTGRSSADRDLLENLVKDIQSFLLNFRGKRMPLSELKSKLPDNVSEKLDGTMLSDVIVQLEDQNVISYAERSRMITVK